MLVTAFAWRENLALGFTDVDALADAAFAGQPWSEQPFALLTGGVGGSNANFWRPVVMLHYKLLRSLFGMDPFGWQIWDLGLHLVCVGLLGRLVGGWRGLVAGALFALHPLQVEVVPAVARNIDLLLGLFVLLGLLAARRRSFAATVVFTALALGSKETAVAALPVIVLWWGFHGRKHTLALAGTLGAVLAAYLAVRTQVLAGLGGYGSGLGVEGFVRAFAAGPVGSLFPGWSDTFGSRHPWGVELGVGLVVLAGLGGTLAARRREPLDWLGMGLWLVPLVLYGVTSAYSRRLMYMPLIGLAIWMSGWALHRHLRYLLVLVSASMLPHVVLVHGHDWASNDQVTRSLTTDAADLLREVPEGARIWVMDRCVRLTEDRARVRTWTRSSLNNCVANYSIQAWADDAIGRAHQFTLFNLSYPVTPLDEPVVRIEGDELVITRVIAGWAVYDRTREAGWEVQRDGDTTRMRYTGERRNDHLLIASGRAPVLVAVP